MDSYFNTSTYILAQQAQQAQLTQQPQQAQQAQLTQQPQQAQKSQTGNFNIEMMMQMQNNYMKMQISYMQMHQKNNDLESEIRKLKEDLSKFDPNSNNNNQLLGYNEELVQISKNLISENGELKSKITENTQKVKLYENEIQVLSKTISKMTTEIADLKKKNSQPMNYEILYKNDQLEAEINRIHQENIKLSDKIYELEDTINKFKKSNHYWVVNLCHFLTKYGLAKHNAEIREILNQIKDDYSRTGAFVTRLKVILDEQKKVMFPSGSK